MNSWRDFNLYNSLRKFSRHKLLIVFLFFSRKKQDLTFHANCLQWRQFARNVKFYFLGKIRKNISKCRLLKILNKVLSVNTEKDTGQFETVKNGSGCEVNLQTLLHACTSAQSNHHIQCLLTQHWYLIEHIWRTSKVRMRADMGFSA